MIPGLTLTNYRPKKIELRSQITKKVQGGPLYGHPGVVYGPLAPPPLNTQGYPLAGKNVY